MYFSLKLILFSLSLFSLLCSRPSKMLSGEVMSLEADIKRLREGIARLTSSASVSSGPLYRGSVAKSDSSSSTCEEQPRR